MVQNALHRQRQGLLDGNMTRFVGVKPIIWNAAVLSSLVQTTYPLGLKKIVSGITWLSLNVLLLPCTTASKMAKKSFASCEEMKVLDCFGCIAIRSVSGQDSSCCSSRWGSTRDDRERLKDVITRPIGSKFTCTWPYQYSKNERSTENL